MTRFFVLVALSLLLATTSQAASKVQPVDVGTFSFFPVLGVYGEPWADGMQASCGQTTSENLEYRRGFVEFIVPDLPGGVRQAILVFQTFSGIFPPPPSPVALNELSFYAADLIVNVTDYDRPTTPITTFESDWSVSPQVFRLDVTGPVAQYRGQALGFRIKLASDPVQCIGSGRDYFGALLEIRPGKLPQQ